jgi:flavorubredoxin
MEIQNRIHYVGISTKELKIFENLWELDYGVSFNSYLIDGEKKALVDACPKNLFERLKQNIEKVVKLNELSYLIINHLEPDHSESASLFLEQCPQLKILTTKMGASMLSQFYGINDRVIAVKDGDSIDLGGFILKFLSTPFIHWPETMMTFEEKTKTLFSGDSFGGFGYLNEKIFAEDSEESFFEEERFRYFVNILSSYLKNIEKALEKIEKSDIKIVCPSHGKLFKNPISIFEKYHKWCGYSSGKSENYVPIIASTMYGMSLKSAEMIKEEIDRAGISSQIFDLTQIPYSHILKEIYKAKGVIFISPTYEGGLFPKMADLLFRIKAKQIKDRKVAYAGSFAWAGGAKKEFEEFCKVLNWQLLSSCEFKGAPQFSKGQIEEMVKTFLNSIKE